MAGWAFDTFPPMMKARAIQYVKEWLDTDKWMVISGAVGTGKTGLAVCSYKAAIDLGIYAAFWRVSTLLEQEKITFSPESGAQSIVEPLQRSCDFLVLDDVGSERGTDWATSLVRDLLTARYEKNLRTVLTTNFTEEELGKCYGERLRDRLGDVAVLLTLTGASLRPRMPRFIA